MFIVCRVLILALVLLLPTVRQAQAHGGVAFEDDLCVINIGFLKAHFTIYQPQHSGSEEFCEDIPAVSDTMFVMEYQHDFLRQMPVDFRIIRDEQDFGIYARWEDVQTIPDLDAVTAFYQPAVVRPEGSFTANYRFDAPGTYIGIVTAKHPEDDRVYNAVFYFQVGGADYGSLPLFAVLALCLQAAYWVGSGGLKRWRERR
ncbi:MAG: hypothetical protein H7A05_05285 [Pseudomonadales bacterium]|nr:hypothetical protein [Pseudomonadales bacterium]MCP5330373.1 hypothetical protein [Pseudomonadales bacterium]MCP5344014.1 hypothetical protein [Pseudomonadales bacterium]